MLGRCVLFLLLLVSAVSAQSDYELSYLLVRTADGAVLAEQEADKLRVPASTLKIVTAAAALESLSGQKTFSTVLMAEGEIRRGRLSGPLYLRGEADPELTKESFQSLVSQLRKAGVRRLEGDLIVDAGPYSFPLYGSGWAWDDAGQYYSPEITGVSVDGGLVGLEKQSLPKWLERQEGPGKSRLLIPGREGVQVRGTMPAYIAPPRMALRSGEMLVALMQESGIKFQGEVKEGAARGNVLAAHHSRPLSAILKKALRVSDNLAMELVYRAAEKRRPSALEEQRLRVVDGSGLSRYNLISARQLVSVLTSNDLRRLLPAPGEGTLEKRFLKGWAAHNLVAKTGTMSNVSALTGYLFPGTDKECIFAIMINGHLESTAKRKAIEDDLVQEWARQVGWPYVLE